MRIVFIGRILTLTTCCSLALISLLAFGGSTVHAASATEADCAKSTFSVTFSDLVAQTQNFTKSANCTDLGDPDAVDLSLDSDLPGGEAQICYPDTNTCGLS